MGKPLVAIPQVLTDDKKISNVLNALKHVIDIREGRGTADAGKMWVTFDDLKTTVDDLNTNIDLLSANIDDLWAYLYNINTGSCVFSEQIETAEVIGAGNFVEIFKDTEDNDTLKIRRACSLVDETHQFKACNGYLLSGYAKGLMATVYYNGINTAYSEFDSLMPGSIVYLSDIAGKVSQTRKTDASLQMVGMVVKSGIFFMPGDVIPYIPVVD